MIKNQLTCTRLTIGQFGLLCENSANGKLTST